MATREFQFQQHYIILDQLTTYNGSDSMTIHSAGSLPSNTRKLQAFTMGSIRKAWSIPLLVLSVWERYSDRYRGIKSQITYESHLEAQGAGEVT